ncbi:hypothetical protein IFM53868_07828 [Aspergillus udagawae]|uniref:Cytochrome P450 n=1 Tax=Aspergillus udagawae TaxID=91492 RepID=A0ABQ1B716_9EURO|nr:hypothetical protein IFM53868_07828 [Aspergillus udagawae]GFG13314.1 hypothetical protein IFM5058_06386 [Aspergillus udagawae]
MTQQLSLVPTYPYLPIGLILVVLLPIFIALLFGHWKIPPSFPRGIPRVGGRKNTPGGLIACFRGWLSRRLILSEGYDKFNRHGRAFIYANGNLRPQAVVPVKDFEWIIRQSDSLLSLQEVVNQFMGFHHLLPSHFVSSISPLEEKISSNVIGKVLTQNLDRIQSSLADELRRNIDNEFGMDCHNWRPICLAEVMQRVLVGLSTWISWGLPLAHDTTYLRSFAKLLNFQGSAIIVCGQLTPWFLQPLLGTFFRIPLHFAQQRVWAATGPLIQEWLTQIEQEEREHISEKDSRVPYNVVTSFIRESRRLYGPKKLNVENLSLYVNLLTAIPFMTTVPASSAAILDIASSPLEIGLDQRLRQEAATVLRSEKDWAAPISFMKLRYLNSAILESLRLTPVLLLASNREVIHPAGITLPTGQHLPRGMWVAASTMDIHTDERFYSEGQSYQPFRFVEEQTTEDDTSLSKETKTRDTGMPTQKVTKVATKSTYLPFGTGRHACPGRHFGVHLLKMIIAYIVLNYDIEHLDKRPENITCGDQVLPSPSGTVRVRRREAN